MNCFWGCLHGCRYCSARNMARRFGRSLAEKRGYPLDVGEKMRAFQPVFLPDQAGIGRVPPKFRSRNPHLQPGQAMIFCEEMGDIMGDWVPDKVIWTLIQQEILSHPQHVVQILTKNPFRLANFNPWPANCWVGASATDPQQIKNAFKWLSRVEARVSFISLEPLLGRIVLHPTWFEHSGVNWIIVGQQTPPSRLTMPPKDWVEDLTDDAARAGVPIFQKNNLSPLLGESLRQEWPK